MKESQPITVFYDGGCSICHKEISYYQKISVSKKINWENISLNPKALEDIGISQVEVFRYLYTKDQNGNILKGIDSFILIWRQFDIRWRLLSYFAALPVIKQMLQVAYFIFAYWRFKKRGYGISQNDDG